MRFQAIILATLGTLNLTTAQKQNPTCVPTCLPPKKCIFDNTCAAACCGPEETAIARVCYPKGTTLCGSTTCNPDQSCTIDNNKDSICCPKGKEAINKKCVDPGTTICGTTTCSPDKSCVIDNNKDSICCPKGEKAINKECVNAGTNLCSDGKTICKGDTPQCTINVSVYIDSTGGAVYNTICCANGYKALNGKCYPGNAKLMPCYRDGDKPCDWGKGYYCAWNAGNADSKCCKLDEYYRGESCVKKP